MFLPEFHGYKHTRAQLPPDTVFSLGDAPGGSIILWVNHSKGSDSQGTGSIESPLRSVQEAVNRAGLSGAPVTIMSDGRVSGAAPNLLIPASPAMTIINVRGWIPGIIGIAPDFNEITVQCDNVVNIVKLVGFRFNNLIQAGSVRRKIVLDRCYVTGNITGAQFNPISIASWIWTDNISAPEMEGFWHDIEVVGLDARAGALHSAKGFFPSSQENINILWVSQEKGTDAPDSGLISQPFKTLQYIVDNVIEDLGDYLLLVDSSNSDVRSNLTFQDYQTYVSVRICWLGGVTPIYGGIDKLTLGNNTDLLLDNGWINDLDRTVNTTWASLTMEDGVISYPTSLFKPLSELRITYLGTVDLSGGWTFRGDRRDNIFGYIVQASGRMVFVNGVDFEQPNSLSLHPKLMEVFKDPQALSGLVYFSLTKRIHLFFSGWQVNTFTPGFFRIMVTLPPKFKGFLEDGLRLKTRRVGTPQDMVISLWNSSNQLVDSGVDTVSIYPQDPESIEEFKFSPLEVYQPGDEIFIEISSSCRSGDRMELAGDIILEYEEEVG